MKAFRKVLFWAHLVTGVAAALVVLVMSATGVLLTYERQTIAWADVRGLDGRPPTPEAPPLGTAALLEAASRGAAGSPTAIIWRADPEAPVVVAFGRDGNRFLNAYTGRVLGDGSPGVRAFFGGVRDWHRWLAREGDARPLGRSITGASNLGFLFLLVSGVYLWWPRNWSPAALRNVLLFRGGLSGKARDFNWHNVIGFWSAVPLFVVVLSGVVISYPWASGLVYRVVGEAPPAPGGGGGGGAVRGGLAPGPGAAGAADRVFALAGVESVAALRVRAAEYEPEWRSISLAMPAAAGAPVVLTLDRGDGGQPQRRGQLTLDRATGEVVTWEPFSSSSRGRQLRSLLRFAHTGEVAGIPGQTLAGLVSIGALVLVWTGLALSWRRLRAWRARRDAPRSGRDTPPRVVARGRRSRTPAGRP